LVCPNKILLTYLKRIGSGKSAKQLHTERHVEKSIIDREREREREIAANELMDKGVYKPCVYIRHCMA